MPLPGVGEGQTRNFAARFQPTALNVAFDSEKVIGIKDAESELDLNPNLCSPPCLRGIDAKVGHGASNRLIQKVIAAGK